LSSQVREFEAVHVAKQSDDDASQFGYLVRPFKGGLKFKSFFFKARFDNKQKIANTPDASNGNGAAETSATTDLIFFWQRHIANGACTPDIRTAHARTAERRDERDRYTGGRPCSVVFSGLFISVSDQTELPD
jgi:hypothetical protein